MFEFLAELPEKITHHFATMSTLVLVATIVHYGLPLIAYLINRVCERNTYKRLVKLPGMTEEKAREQAKEFWRPKKKPSRVFLFIKRRMKEIFSRK